MGGAQGRKQDVIDRLHGLVGLSPEPLGPGSKERKRTFEVVAQFLGVEVSPSDTKPDLAAKIAATLGIGWGPECFSAGDTLTLQGVTRITEALEIRSQMVGTRSNSMDGGAVTHDEDVLDDARTELEHTIADLVAELSRQMESPDEFTSSHREVTADEVDFRSNAWMAGVDAVQGWLHFDSPIPLADPGSFAGSLVRELGVGDEEAEVAGDRWTLSILGLERLRDRADRALRLQQEFLSELDADGGTVRAATSAWADRWDEEQEEEGTSSGPVRATASVWQIQKFSYLAVRGRLNLSPSYQRGDVWPTTDSQMLIESILRGIPLPSVIILKPGKDDARPYEVVDGKQRLTAILRFMGKHPLALAKVSEVAEQHPTSDLERLFHDDYPKFRRAWKNVTGELLNGTSEREYYFPFKLRRGVAPLEGPLAPLQGKYYSEIRDFSIEVATEKEEVREVFEMTSGYCIPIIEYAEASPRQVHEVFNLYNRQGKHLNAEEIRNALFHGLDLMRGLIVAAGDNGAVDEVAPFLRPAWPTLSGLEKLLTSYGFGESRYRRTKVLSWLAAVVFASPVAGPHPKLPSTARQIDTLLRRVEGSSSDPLRDEATLRSAFDVMLRGVEAHSAIGDAWAPRFMDNGKGAKWQELQLIASLVGVTLAGVVLSDGLEDALEEAAEELYRLTGSEDWARPKKTQTSEQWRYVGDVAMGILAALDVDPAEVALELEEQFGHSCVGTLQALQAERASAAA